MPRVFVIPEVQLVSAIQGISETPETSLMSAASKTLRALVVSVTQMTPVTPVISVMSRVFVIQEAWPVFVTQEISETPETYSTSAVFKTLRALVASVIPMI